jgi:hypothetical protein
MEGLKETILSRCKCEKIETRAVRKSVLLLPRTFVWIPQEWNREASEINSLSAHIWQNGRV